MLKIVNETRECVPPWHQMKAIRQAAQELYSKVQGYSDFSQLPGFPHRTACIIILRKMFTLDTAFNPLRHSWIARKSLDIRGWSDRADIGLHWVRDWLDCHMRANGLQSLSDQHMFDEWLANLEEMPCLFPFEKDEIEALGLAIVELCVGGDPNESLALSSPQN